MRRRRQSWRRHAVRLWREADRGIGRGMLALVGLLTALASTLAVLGSC